MSTLKKLTEDIQLRYPNTLPTHPIDIEELRRQQGQQDVVTYILGYLQANEEEINRDDILRDS